MTWYKVTLLQREDCAQLPLVVYARSLNATHSECRIGGDLVTPVTLPRLVLARVAKEWSPVTDEDLLRRLG